MNSKKLRYNKEDFYVRIKGYGHNAEWARCVVETADNAVQEIRNGINFENVLKYITNGIIKANQIPLDIDKRKHTGILRIARDGWKHGSEWNNGELITRYNARNRYKTYADRLDRTVKSPLRNPYKDIFLSRPFNSRDEGKYILHGDYNYIGNAFSRINAIFKDIYEKYILKEAKEENLNDINSNIAEIRWILAHATPWERGSDAISNTFIRALYKAMGIKVSPLKKGISLDLEAYCTELDEYKRNFHNYFSRKMFIPE